MYSGIWWVFLGEPLELSDSLGDLLRFPKESEQSQVGFIRLHIQLMVNCYA